MANYLPAETVNEIKAGLAAGLSLRAVARLSGTSTNTVRRYVNDNERRQCPCGGPSGHKGWCRWRYEQSPRRQATIRRKWFGDDVVIPLAPPRRSRAKEARDRWAFVFGYAEDWRERAVPLPADEYFGVIGEVGQATKRVPFEAREDVKHSIILAVYEGRVLRNQIEEVVSAFFKHEMKNTIGSMWSLWLSLDQPFDSSAKSGSFLGLLSDEADVGGDGIWRPEELLRSRRRRAA